MKNYRKFGAKDSELGSNNIGRICQSDNETDKKLDCHVADAPRDDRYRHAELVSASHSHNINPSQPSLKKGRSVAFTLAEMMVVLLIASIILACMAPIMTTKMKADSTIQTSPWKWAKDNINAYYSVSSNQAAMIGQNERADTDNAKLIINNATNLDDMILFKRGNTVAAHLSIGSNVKILLGSLKSGSTLGAYSIGIGQAVQANSYGVAIGRQAAASAGWATALGYKSSASGSNSVAVGDASEASSSYSTAVGDNTTASGAGSTVLGAYSEASAQNSVAIGRTAVTKATGSIAIGSGATIADGRDISYGDGTYNTTPLNSIAIGTNASIAEGAERSIAIGASASSGSFNSIAIGSSATTGDERSIAIGSRAHALGSSNIAIGDDAMASSTSGGTGNIAIGNSAMFNQDNGNDGNVAIGYQAMYGTSKSSNYWNTAIGYRSQYKSGTTSSNAGHNTSVGYQSLYSNETGGSNTAIGTNACYYVKGNNKTCIGEDSGPASGTTYASADNTDKIMFLGDSGTTVYIPGNLVVEGNVLLSNTNAAIVARPANNSNYGVIRSDDMKGGDDNFRKYPTDISNINQAWFDKFMKSSDRRLKNVGEENTDGLTKLRQLKIYNYIYKADKDKIPQVGVIAQDLQKVFPNAVKKAPDGFLKIRLEDMFYAVINAIKELDAKYQTQQKQIKQQEIIIKQLQEDNKKLKMRLDKLEAKVK